MKYDLTIFQPHDRRVFLLGFPSPKQKARGREADQLFVFLSLKSQTEEIDLLNKELENQANAFFKTSGSVTKAMRVFVNGINRFFLEQNHHFDQPESWQTASLVLSVIHYDTLFLAQVGAGQTQVFSDGKVELFFEESLDQRGLGVATVTNPRYFQSSLKGNETIVFGTHEIDAFESDEIAPLIGELKLRAEENQPLGIVVVSGGSGQIKAADLDEFDFATLLPQDMAGSAADVEEIQQGQQPTSETTVDDHETNSHGPSLAEDLFGQAVLYQADNHQEELKQDDQPETITQPQPEDEEQEPTRVEAVAEEHIEEILDSPDIEKPDLDTLKEKVLQGVVTGAGWLRNVEEKAESIVAAGETTGESQKNGVIKELSLMTKALIAILVPLVIVFGAAMVYFNRGEDHEYAYYLAQAQASANNAALMQTSELQREGWEQTLIWLNQAAGYENTAEVRALRTRAQIALDDLDGARRLQYVPAFAASLYPELDIAAIVSLNNDLYVLDRRSRSVKYLRLHTTGYEMDSEFVCQAGTYGGVQVGELVDLISIPLNNPAKAPVMAIDSNGNLIYCSPGTSPSAAHLPTPETGWAELKKMVFDSNRLYVLDPGNKALWIYRGFTADFNNAPDTYFDEEILDLSTAIDLEVEGEELFLLYADGHSSHCLASFVTGLVSCENPYPYLDAGTSGANVDFSTLKFEQIAYSPPPDPSIYYLEAERAEIYQFSLRLNLNKVLRSWLNDADLPKRNVSAFYVSQDRRVFLAFGNQLFYAVLP
ncbi:MAG: hypothetical protein WDA04_03905 [Anaerolineaceae bacterium]